MPPSLATDAYHGDSAEILVPIMPFEMWMPGEKRAVPAEEARGLTPIRPDRPVEVLKISGFDNTGHNRTHAAYDAEATHRFWRALVQVDRVFKLFRTGFLGKVRPVHFFWGSFDLAVTRFSERTASSGGVSSLPDAVTREAYSNEVSSAGFWAGNDALPRAAFYSYAYPEPPGFRDRPVTLAAHFDRALGEFILPYDAVRNVMEPDGFCSTFYLRHTPRRRRQSAGTARRWECPMSVPG